MTTDETPTALDCGTTIERLTEYLESGRTPVDRHIESCPECLNALEALERVGRLSRDLIADDAARLPATSDGWFERILTTIHSELRAGRSFPISHPDPRVHITVTEGAVKALLRTTGDSLDGVYISRTQIEGDAETPGAPVEINLTASVRFGIPLPELADELRALAHDTLLRHTELNVTAVNIAVEDLHGTPPG
ncbi:Asp23/Gls24 family envelope stress response protein [Leucobacter rhizosphaerae]|uniref:Asp23/Gls24 family envelope stress response protein n=1 Tax=Leucobacter rhizosphaerae TaxID=2932245 RepID=A0ABY4FT17_9MICO|nr:Asp23/Gls24 family envelope stress response protein [Leucobacter rhizosphaerae]UOQ59401.1 Asp23/Gls24 family envelope stress response protein [Leucobacter rhizosphaerae]